MRRFLLALSLVLGFGSLAAASAQAQGLSVTFDTGPAYGRPVYGRPVEYRPAPVYRPYPRYRQVEYPPQPAYRPYRYARPAYYGPHCFTRTERQWNGFGWVRVAREVCR